MGNTCEWTTVHSRGRRRSRGRRPSTVSTSSPSRGPRARILPTPTSLMALSRMARPRVRLLAPDRSRASQRAEFSSRAPRRRSSDRARPRRRWTPRFASSDRDRACGSRRASGTRGHLGSTPPPLAPSTPPTLPGTTTAPFTIRRRRIAASWPRHTASWRASARALRCMRRLPTASGAGGPRGTSPL